jgi:hypothetical protein
MIEQQTCVTYKGEAYELTPILTDRFVWHLSIKKYRKGIQTTGLEPKKGLAFANSQCEEIDNMWHWELDYRYVGLTDLKDDVILNKICSAIDFWRIDTEIFEGNWYYDPIMKGWGDFDYRYVCTPQHIPLEAITLYKFDLGTYRRIKYGKNKKWTNRPEGQLPLLKV